MAVTPLLSPWQNAAAKYAIDPYLVWAVITGFRQFIRLDEPMPGDIDFVAELDKPYQRGVYPLWPKSALQFNVWVPAEYDKALPGSRVRARYITVRLPAAGKAPGTLIKPVLDLIATQGVTRLQIGFPRPPQIPDGPVPAASKRWRWLDPHQRPKVLLGLLEDACPFAHPALAKAPRQTRVFALWDQTSNGDQRPLPPGNMGYGTQFKQQGLDALLGAQGTGRDDAELYLDPAAHQPLLNRRSSHATAVTTLMAGRADALPSHPMALPCGTLEPVLSGEALPPRAPLDDAASAPLVVVQFPYEQVAIPTARWMAVRALDGLRYLARGSALLAAHRKPPLPLVANLSYGSMAGAHDGTGLLEAAMDELAAAHGRMAITLAAGNGHGTRRDPEAGPQAPRRTSGRHAQATMAAGQHAVLGLYVPPNKALETYLEIWLDKPPSEALDGLLASGDLSVTVTPPATSFWPPFTATCPDIQVQPTAGEPAVGLFVLPKAAQSTRRSLVCLVVSATQVSSTRVEAPAGLWTVTVSNRSSQPMALQAWVERDIVHGRIRPSQQAARLVSLDDPNAATLTDANTFNNIATGAQPFRVGALLAACDGEGQHPVSPYSAEAASSQQGPEFSAVADTSALRPGIRVSGSTGGQQVRMNGTSVAAPQAARAIANRLAAGETLAKIRADIAQSTQGDARRGRLEV